MQHVPILKDIVLLGGGHTHSLVVKKWGMKPLPGVRLTLISQSALTPYSGMLPGFVAGHYTREETHIDLARLCRWSGVRFIEARADGVDTDARCVQLENHPNIEYDLLSIDTGSTPDVESVPGASEFTVPVKPVYLFEQKWQALLDRVKLHQRNSVATQGGTTKQSPAQQTQDDIVTLGVVGAGVGGFELLLALDHALKQQSANCQLHWFVRGSAPLRQQPDRVASYALDECKARGIEVHVDFAVAEVRKNAVQSTSGVSVNLDEILWVTAARAPSWPRQSGFATDERGFIKVDQTLRSISHADVFAAGDIACLPAPGVAKAGVFAVRQAPVLFDNLRRAVCQQSLRSYRPQKNFLTLISLGDKAAIASRNGLAIRSDQAWQAKDWIDRKFMNKFFDLPERKMRAPTVDDVPAGLLASVNSEQAGASGDVLSDTSVDASADNFVETDLMFCGGCGAKVGADVLAAVIDQLQPVKSASVTSDGLADDSCTIHPEGKLVVQSVDQFRASFDNNYLFGRIAALHALSDLYASGAQPDSALALATLPFADAVIQRRDLGLMMTGAVEELNRAGCMLAGGHTGIGAEAMLGFTVNGFISNTAEAKAEAKAKASFDTVCEVGDVIVLTKPLGTGVVLAADMRAKASGADVQIAMQSMLQSNREAAEIFVHHQVRVMTDVTGFGLLGHLANLLRRLQTDGACNAQLDLNAIPFMPAALEHAANGIRSSLYSQNARVFTGVDLVTSSNVDDNWRFKRELLVDPQTNGGLLAIVPANDVANCIEALVQHYPATTIIGTLQSKGLSHGGSISLSV